MIAANHRTRSGDLVSAAISLCTVNDDVFAEGENVITGGRGQRQLCRTKCDVTEQGNRAAGCICGLDRCCKGSILCSVELSNVSANGVNVAVKGEIAALVCLQPVRQSFTVGGYVSVNDVAAQCSTSHSDLVQGKNAAVSHIEGSAAVCGDGVLALTVDDKVLVNDDGIGQGDVSNHSQRAACRNCSNCSLKAGISSVAADNDGIVDVDVTVDHAGGRVFCSQKYVRQSHRGVSGNTIVGKGSSGNSDVHIGERHCNVTGQGKCLIQLSRDVVLALAVDGQALIKSDSRIKCNVSKQGNRAICGSIGERLCKGAVEVHIAFARAAERCLICNNKHVGCKVLERNAAHGGIITKGDCLIAILAEDLCIALQDEFRLGGIRSDGGTGFCTLYRRVVDRNLVRAGSTQENGFKGTDYGRTVFDLYYSIDVSVIVQTDRRAGHRHHRRSVNVEVDKALVDVNGMIIRALDLRAVLDSQDSTGGALHISAVAVVKEDSNVFGSDCGIVDLNDRSACPLLNCTIFGRSDRGILNGEFTADYLERNGDYFKVAIRNLNSSFVVKEPCIVVRAGNFNVNVKQLEL